MRALPFMQHRRSYVCLEGAGSARPSLEGEVSPLRKIEIVCQCMTNRRDQRFRAVASTPRCSDGERSPLRKNKLPSQCMDRQNPPIFQGVIYLRRSCVRARNLLKNVKIPYPCMVCHNSVKFPAGELAPQVWGSERRNEFCFINPRQCNHRQNLKFCTGGVFQRRLLASGRSQ